VDYNPYLNILMSGGLDGTVETWDYRERTKVNKVIANNGSDITKIKHDSSGYLFCAGSADGLVRLYDLRYSSHVLEVQHHYREPIKSIWFHEASKNIMSADKKIIKFYNKNTGKIFTNIEPKAEINDVELIEGSGLIFVASDDVRIGQYFIPELGPAPKWCPLIENITEELEEELNSTVYDEFKFLTVEDLEALNASHLIGSKMLKRYMHGYMMPMKTYHKLKDIHDPFAYQKYIKDKISKKLEDQRQNRITIKKKIPKVNPELMDELEKKNEHKKKKFDVSYVMDPRFDAMFNKEEFKIDKSSEAYLQNNPSGKKGRHLRQDEDSFDEAEEQYGVAHANKKNNEVSSHINELKKKTKMNFEDRITEMNDKIEKKGNFKRNLHGNKFKKTKKF